ncbi:PiT family inorganic phosphate transporter [Desulfitobacterium sp. LBE]|uniref:Inorganic phosphate transporter n=5 Tax=root TaxID=1 RepID=Q24SL8_DESHY|nr:MULTISPECIES: inorganic phosphate transporter [Desulfitobacterium]ACL22363.1 phosphate transporter [Desulfitobacterium hafniense DCB-2]EHL04350.1 phosphate transporter family protein [Desulfitobacterium hafniense DP7]KTE92181.1 inorganic phosphate transporter [Desulfitobacterium hafniense]MEA5021467.1 inorganic phosphate transporter [Desulfitobacterium hafniense]TWH59861.1 PiT family inorganic phosphate transporter [Desulfitobacterium sp. LBE]
MISSSALLIVVVFFALAFDYINGFHDTANAIATSVSTRALTPKRAIVIAAILNFAGALVSTGVAQTIAKDIVNPDFVTQELVIAALIGAIFWNLATWYFGIPSSSSHAIIGGMIGAAVSKVGFGVLQVQGILKIIAALLVSPIIGIILGFIIMKTLYFIFGKVAPSKVNQGFRKMQVLSAGLLAFNHGSNDAQKSMGIITMALIASGLQDPANLNPALWVKFACAMAMALGTAAGGWKIIRTMGGKIFKLEPINGFAADLTSSIVIWTATAFPGLHLPVSTTHVVSGSIMGVGSAKRISAVRWGVAQQMLVAWVVTIPTSALTSFLMYKLVTLVL